MKFLLLFFILTVSLASILAQSSKCYDPVQTGRCMAYFKRYAYTREKGCHEFVYGGCGANDNNFKTKEECEQECMLPR